MVIRVASVLFLIGIVPALAGQAAVAPPAGAPLLVEAQADGVQIYACEAKDNGAEWVFKAPEANLFDAKEGRSESTSRVPAGSSPTDPSSTARS
jgi:hypothetical protein